jgi:putrescine transport system permease protein
MNTKLAIKLVIAVPYIWLLFFFLLPFLIVLKIALSDLEYAIMPPYTPQFASARAGRGSGTSSRSSISRTSPSCQDDLYIKAYLSSLQIAFDLDPADAAGRLSLAYGMARAPDEWRPTLLMLVILPFWTSFLIRVYAWIGILKQEGAAQPAPAVARGDRQPLEILSTNTAVYIGIVYSYLPFMVLPIYSPLEKMDESLLEAASDLGCTRIGAFWLVTAAAVPGVLAGCLLVFIPAVGEFVIPDLLGGSDTLMIGKTLWIEFFNNRDWPVASAIAVSCSSCWSCRSCCSRTPRQERGGGP